MRLSIFNLLSIATIIALTVALVITRQTRTISLQTGFIGIRELPEKVLTSSLWNDKSKPPPISATKAYQIAQKAVDDLSPLPKSDPWEFNYISLEHLSLNGNNCWIYVVELERLRSVSGPSRVELENAQIMIAMDGTVILEGGNYPAPENSN